MGALFADVPEALANTLVIAQRCTALAPYRNPILPSLAGDRTAEDAQLREDARLGLIQRLETAGITDEATRQVYFDRLTFEADVICSMGFSGYFLIVADFIKWAKEQDIAVGLLFERFLNPDRVSMPDFDIDFCETRRGEVIRYVQKKYGTRQVAQIITFGKLKARAVLRDTGRVLQMSYGQVDRLCKQVPNLPADPWDLQRALAGVAELREEYRRDAQVKRLFDLAMKLEGLPRHSSTHAAGVVIGDRELSELAPLYRDPRSDMPVTQFDMKYVESAGLVKFDFLGLKTLSVLQKATQMLAKRGVDTLGFCRMTTRQCMNCCSVAIPSVCSSWNPKGCGGRLLRLSPPISVTLSRSYRSTARAQWTISRCSADAKMAKRASNIRTRCSSPY
jgi:DNA polymerase-3 subunit alpha